VIEVSTQTGVCFSHRQHITTKPNIRNVEET
jgi:hypothetical protein